MKSKQEPAITSKSDALFDSIKGIAENLQVLNRQAVQEYAPIVEDIINSRSSDTNHIEHMLDGLVSFCGYAPAVDIFKKLCRYYWQIDQNGAAYYVKLYREMWES